jgi:uncharacterized protein YbjT (DUF2867 family)
VEDRHPVISSASTATRGDRAGCSSAGRIAIALRREGRGVALAGEIRGPQRDVAAVAVLALLSNGHAGRSYVLTGPQSLSQRDKVRLIGEAIGRKLSFQESSAQQARQAMLAQGLPDDVPDRMLGYLADHVEQQGPSTDTVQQLLVTFATWVAENAAAFRSQGDPS